MKRYILLFYALLFLTLLLFAGCCGTYGEPSPYQEVNTLDGIWVEVKEETVTPKGLEFILHNTADRADFFYGSWYSLEVCVKEQWFIVNPLPDVEWSQLDWARRVFTKEELSQDRFKNGGTDWAVYLPNEMGFNWELYYGEQPPGVYRIVINLLSNLDKPIEETSPKYYLAAEFSIV